MSIKIVIDFFKAMDLYNEKYFNIIQKNTKIYDRPYEEIKDFVGCYPIYNKEKNVVDFKLILPKIESIYDILIYIHEYTHALFIDDDSEIFPNIMEAFFINSFVDEELKLEIIEKTERELEISQSFNHIIGKKIKIMSLKRKL